MNFLPSPFNLSIRPALGVTREEILDDGEGEGYRDSIETESETERQFLSSPFLQLKRLSQRVVTFIMESQVPPGVK